MFCSFSLLGWNQQVKEYTIKRSTQVQLQGQSNYGVTLQNMEMPAPGGDSEKARLMRLKEDVSSKYPRKSHAEAKAELKLNLPTVEITTSFKGNNYGGRVPNDNSIAISDSGILISFINSNYYFYDINEDSLLDFGYLDDYLQGLNITSNKYDPKVTYDPEEDRFVMVFLIGTLASKSQIATSFSTSNNPLDPWNTYLLQGDALETGHWTDYPAIALSKDEFFLTGNLLSDNQSWQTGFHESIIWQIDKHRGYNGDSLHFQVWSGFIDDTVKIRNIHPVKGARKLYGPNQYFLSNKNFSAESDTLYLIEINNTLASGIAQSSVTRISLPDHYFMSPNGIQYNGEYLATNDSRVLGAIRDDNWIQFVHNCMDTTNGTAGIYHGTIANLSSNLNAWGTILSDTVKDFGYPNIASTAIDPNEMECVIGFNWTSAQDTNGVACYYMNNDQIHSEFTNIKQGNSAMAVLPGNVERWGDYFGIQRRFSEPCRVWVGGMCGLDGFNSTWIAEVSVSDTCRTPLPIDTSAWDTLAFTNAVFPNPMINRITIDFEMLEEAFVIIDLIDANGRLVDEIFTDVIKEGENRLSFDLSPLASGFYVLRARKEGHILFTEKIIKK